MKKSPSRESLQSFLASLKPQHVHGSRSVQWVKKKARSFIEAPKRAYDEHDTVVTSWGETVKIHTLLLCCLYDNV